METLLSGSPTGNNIEFDNFEEISTLEGIFYILIIIIVGIFIYMAKHKKNPTIDSSDMISELPDEILHHILYFSGMKQAVQMSVLSKRWRDIWKSMSRLSFSFEDTRSSGFNPNRNVFQFARKIVRRRDYKNCRVLKIHFRVDYYFVDALGIQWDKMDAWLSKVIKFIVGLEVIELECKHRYFNKGSETLRLTFFPWNKYDINVTSMVRSLELWNTMDLDNAEFTLRKDEYNNLESIVIVDGNHFKIIKIHQNRLKVLKLRNCGVSNCKIQVFAPNLVSLYCKQIATVSLCIVNTPCFLNDAFIDFPMDFENVTVSDGNAKMMSTLHNLRSLTISDSVLKVLNMHRDLFRSNPPFHNLTQVVLLPTTSISPITLTGNIIHSLPNILEALTEISKILDSEYNSCQTLKTLLLRVGVTFYENVRNFHLESLVSVLNLASVS